MESFLAFHSDFARLSQRRLVERPFLASDWPHLIVTQMAKDDAPLVMHSDEMDRERSRAALLHSASCFDGTEEQQRRNLLGRGNRLLHFQDMARFQGSGIGVYDFGRYAVASVNPRLTHIDEFKDSPGSERIEESDYASFALIKFGKAATTLGLRRQDDSACR